MKSGTGAQLYDDILSLFQKFQCQRLLFLLLTGMVVFYSFYLY